MILRYIIFFASFFGVIGIGSYSIYKSYTFIGVLGKHGNATLLILLLTMPVLFILTTVISMKTHILINDYMYTIVCIWLPILLYLFIGSILLSIVIVFVPITHSFFYTILTYTLIGISILLTTYGTWNAHRFTTTHISIPKENALSEKWRGKKIILLSDTHIGIVHKDRFLKKVVSYVTSQNPDMVLIAGDLVDGPKFPREAYLGPLGGLKAPLGVYYTPGNHEIYAGDEQNLYAITDPYVTGLRDSKIHVNDTDIIGFMYDAGETPQGVMSRLEKVHYDPNNPTIAIMHDPKNNSVLQHNGVDLIVSGHTHGGQLWPFTAVVKKIFREYTHGLTIKDNTASVTTTGIGTWGPPVRIGTNPEIIVITFE